MVKAFWIWKRVWKKVIKPKNLKFTFNSVLIEKNEFTFNFKLTFNQKIMTKI